MKRIADQTLYEILDVRDDATADEIARACDRARALYGPGSLATYTLMSPEEAALLGSRIEDARTTLLDPALRARYDEALHPRAGEARAVIGASAPAAFPPVIPAAAPSPPSPPEPPRLPEEHPALARHAPEEPLPLARHAPEEAPPLARHALEESEEAEAPGEAEEETDETEEAEEAQPEPVRLVVPAAEPPPFPQPVPPPARVPIRLEREIAEPPSPPAAPARPPAPPAPPPPAPLPSVPEGQPWTGDILRQCREARGISVQQIAERTKVTRHHIENIEAERFGQLPAAVYLRGILLALARELRLDGQKVARSYLERATAAKGK